MGSRANLAVGIIGSTAKAVLWVALATLALGAFGDYAFAQQPAADGKASDDKVLSKDELGELVGKIALYPDDLVAIVLPASTYPLQVVEAARFLEERKKDPNLKPSDKWDDSVVALLNYPEVVKLMNNDLDWTWKLGDAVINQRGEVLDAIQSFRTRAAAAGNLHTDEHQVVQNDEQGDVSIKPADPQVVYVPYYDPEQVVVSQPTPVYYYYPYGYPLYYYPYPYGYPFAAGYFWGVTTAFVIGWHSHYVHVVHCGYYGHPYYGHTYYGGYYVRRDANVAVSHGHYVWEPHYRAGGQPFTRSDGRQLAIAHHDSRAGGAPSGYRSVDRGSSVGYRNGNPGDGHGNYSTGRGDDHGNYSNGHGGDGHGSYSNGRGGDGHGSYSNGRGGDGYGNGQTGDRHDANGHAVDGHGSPSYGANGSNGARNGVRDGTKQIQPIRNDPLTQSAIRNELREHAPGHGNFASPGSTFGRGGTRGSPSVTAPSGTDAHNSTPPARGTYQTPNQGTTFRDPPARTTPQAPQYRNTPQAPQYRNAPQAPAARNVLPQTAAPQMRTMPMPSSPQMRTMTTPSAPREGGASYTYRSPSMSMPQSSAGRAPTAHQGGVARSAGHGGGGHHSR